MYKDFHTKKLVYSESRGKDFDISTNIDAIKNAIGNIILTQIGSLPGRPDFGSKINTLLFDNIDYLTEEMAKRYIRESVGKFEPRINITDITITKAEAFNRIVINIEFNYLTARGIEDSSVNINFNI